MQVISDLIDGTSLEDSMSGGFTGSRAFLVSGVDGNASARLYNALNATGIPQIGEAHPVVTSLTCTSRSVEPANGDNTQFKVSCKYTVVNLPSDEQAQVSVGSVVQADQTTNDVNGNEIKVGPFNYQQGNIQVTMVEQAGVVSRMYPQRTVTFQRRLTDMARLVRENQTYVGKINSTSFNIDPNGNASIPAKEALCTKIQGQSSDGGRSFMVTYEFQVGNEYGWQAMVCYINPETNLPHKEATEANQGKKRVDLYKTADFNALQLV